MQSATDDLRAGLINQILFAASHKEVERMIDEGIKEFERDEPDSKIVGRFINDVIRDLESFTPMKEAALQWSNIKLAKILLTRKQTHYAPAKTI